MLLSCTFLNCSTIQSSNRFLFNEVTFFPSIFSPTHFFKWDMYGLIPETTNSLCCFIVHRHTRAHMISLAVSPFIRKIPQIAKFMGPTWDPPGSCRPQMGPMLAPRTLQAGTADNFSRCCSVFFAQAPWTLLEKVERYKDYIKYEAECVNKIDICGWYI